MEPIDETVLPLTSLMSDLLGTKEHQRFDGNLSKISVVMADAVEPLSTTKCKEKLCPVRIGVPSSTSGQLSCADSAD